MSSKVLSLVWFKIYPPHFGGQKGIALFNKYLAEHFAVDCLCSRNNEIVADAGCHIIPELPLSKTQFFNPFVWRQILKQFKKEDYSFVILEQPYYGLLALWLKRKTKLIIHTHNIESLRFKSLQKKSWPFLFYYEKWSLQKAHLAIFKTEEEKEFAIKSFKLKEANCYILPYGIEDARPYNKKESRKFLSDKYGIKEEEKIILFAGTLDYQPNADAVESIYFKIEPLLRQKLSAYKILICGRNVFSAFAYLKEFKNDNILQAGFVENIEPYFAGADVFINSVQNVHGVQTKLFDAFNYNLNTVCFEATAKELPPYLDKKIFISGDNDFDSFADRIVQSLTPNFDTPEEFYTDYSWSNIVREFVNHLTIRCSN
jgi:hypothetical protein